MKVPSRTASRAHHIVCPFCESGELVSVGPGFARCDSCGLPLLGSALETLRDIIELPDALGSHPCECGHPEMRELPYRVLHCPACGSEVLPIQFARQREVRDGKKHEESPGRGVPKMYPMDPRLLKQMHEQMVRDAQRKALPRELRAARKRRVGWASALARISIKISRLRPRPK